MLAPDRDLWYGTSGPWNAQIVLIGESWGEEEARAQAPFVGSSGKELDRMLSEAGIRREDCFATNVIAAKPLANETERFFEPGAPTWRQLAPSPMARSELTRLYQQLASIRPKVVIACGNWSLWAVTGSASSSTVPCPPSPPGAPSASVRVPTGITSWRGSMLYSDSALPFPQVPVLPILHPAAILRAWYLRAVTIHDLRTRVPAALQGLWRPRTPPEVLAPPTFERARDILTSWHSRLHAGEALRLAHDIETARGLITCVGFANGPMDEGGLALVIPFVRLTQPGKRFDSYWPLDQEAALVRFIRQILVHPNVRIEGQNYLYDTQYIQHYLGITPTCDFDTMLAHHLLFPGTPKGLDYLSSLYCKFHWYWKDDNKDWDTSLDERRHLEYNAVDVLRTWECATVLRELIVSQGLSEQWEWEKRKAALALQMMNRGVRIDRERRARYAFELADAQRTLHSRLERIVPDELCEGATKGKSTKPWYTSGHKQRHLFYSVLGLPRQTNRKTDRTSADDEALRNLSSKHPELRGLFDNLLLSRSLGVFHSTFIGAGVDPDGRMRCSFNPAGTETFRWSSSSNAFGRGTNLQNIPKGSEDWEGFPNVRKIFLPDPGKVIVDADLAGADPIVVAAEADDQAMLADMLSGVNIHSRNARDIWGDAYDQLPGDDGDRTTPKGRRRGECKNAVHATNYGAHPLALTRDPKVRWTLDAAKRFQQRWFELHPGILEWHQRTLREVHTSRCVRNRFGYRIIYFDRVDMLLPQALAWIPQSTVAETCFRGALTLQSACPWVEHLIQVHDSLVFQIPAHRHEPGSLDLICRSLEVPVPYPTPLVIPWKIACSALSWGDCK